MSNTRLFDQHTIRGTDSLDGIWTFFFPREGSCISIEDYEESRIPISLEVPCCWECHKDFVNYRGEAVALRTFNIKKAGVVRLVFKGISHTAEIFVDGCNVGRHYNAFTPFSIELPHLDCGEHQLMVHISNQFSGASTLHIPNDYYTYGGITRPVEIQYLNASTCIRQVHLRSDRNRFNTHEWLLNIETEIIHYGASQTFELSHSSTGVYSCREIIELKEGVNHHKLQIKLSAAQISPWSAENPVLYLNNCCLSLDHEPVDDMIERFAFRTVELDENRVFINGRPVFLKGINRHEDHSEYGCAIPLEIMRSDLASIREMGFNAVRTSHYPNDERFLDLCDEQGIYIWEENHARGLSTEEHNRLPGFPEQCAQCNEEMVMAHFNHPSIIMWGILNECASHRVWGRIHYERQFEQLRGLDASRPLTYASCFQEEDICQDLPDICSWNIYPLWYHDDNGRPRDSVDALYARFGDQLENKPFIISEFGAGAIPGYRDPSRKAKWSEERQALILRQCLEDFLSDDRVAGIFIWQFCDVRVDESWAMNRPRCMNNKGIVDEHRNPKLACDTVKSLLVNNQIKT